MKYCRFKTFQRFKVKLSANLGEVVYGYFQEYKFVNITLFNTNALVVSSLLPKHGNVYNYIISHLTAELINIRPEIKKKNPLSAFGV